MMSEKIRAVLADVLREDDGASALVPDACRGEYVTAERRAISAVLDLVEAVEDREADPLCEDQDLVVCAAALRVRAASWELASWMPAAHRTRSAVGEACEAIYHIVAQDDFALAHTV